ncbi:MAG: ammonium transporter [Nitrospirota bacterium]
MTPTRRKGRGSRTGWAWAALCLAVTAGEAWAEQGTPAPPASGINSGDTAWMLAASALVLAMVAPGLALFYGGLVRSKNVLGTIMQTFVILCLVSVIWALFGYSLAFGPDKGGVVGSLDWAGLAGVGAAPHPAYAPTVPHGLFMVFQLLFAAFTPALIAGAFAERVRFSALLLFTVLWSIFIYSPLAHWLWGGGWLGKMGAVDFAGGAVVHTSSGAAALACALVVGKRRGWRTDYMPPHNLPLVMLGTGILWFGWFGFNGGSARGANAAAVGAVVSTHLAAAAAVLSWMTVEWMHRGKPTVLGAATGAVAGMASSTAGAGFIGPLAALLIGGTAGILCYYAIVWKGRIGYDDALDVVGIHGAAGIVGILAAGLFASKAVNPAGVDGLFFGNSALFGIQALTVFAVVAFAFIGTFVLLKLVDGVIGLRVPPEQESTGLDLSQHNERAYS